MDRYWSTYVQTTDELYQSRALRFREDNMHRWIEAMRLCDGMNLLEVGCAGGLLLHRIKQKLPNSKITGLDFDLGHIEYAKEKTKELGLEGEFVAGDATAMPFEDGIFDATFSHTVIGFCDLTKFVSEQKRVLKKGGRMLIMCAANFTGKPEEWVPTDGCEEKELFDRVWDAASSNPNSDIKRYEHRMEKYCEELANQGFSDISVDTVSVVNYAPDFDNVSDDRAIAQINEDRLSEISSAEKAYRMAPDALTDDEYKTLMEMINRRYDKQIEHYKNGEKTWKFRLSTVVIISGRK